MLGDEISSTVRVLQDSLVAASWLCLSAQKISGRLRDEEGSRYSTEEKEQDVLEIVYHRHTCCTGRCDIDWKGEVSCTYRAHSGSQGEAFIENRAVQE